MNAALERRLSNSTRKTIEGAGHMLPITHPQATAQSIADFWETALGV